jgi:prepilin-type N-terminal cleavage/methylation domain-containing protein
MRLKRAFTIVELLTVLAVLALLVGLLIPSLIMARNAARVAKQKVQLASIDQALLAFRNDDGDYPPSVVTVTTEGAYCGAKTCRGYVRSGFIRFSSRLGF